MSSALRLLPWTTADGKPCYLDSDGNGWLSALADEMESVQLATGAELLNHARSVVDDPKASARELRFVVARLSECLTDALRVAESRGARLGGVAGDDIDSSQCSAGVLG